jgi:hypothetical protein
VLTLDVTSNEKHSPETWEAVLGHVQHVPGVESASLAGWPLMFETAWNDSVGFNGRPASDTLSYFLRVSPEWPQTMKVPIDAGRTLRPGSDGTSEALVNHEFVKVFFHGEDPVGQVFEEVGDNGERESFTVAGVVGDTCYRDLRECVLPVAYLSFHATDPYHKVGGGIRSATLLVKTAAENPASMGATLRGAVADSHSGLRVSNVRTQQSINDVMTMGDRMLAVLAIFFAAVALVLAAIGLYGVMSYSVVQRQREIGVRIAVGARGFHIARSVVARTSMMVAAGAAVGICAGLAASRFFAALLYSVKPTDPRSLVAPLAAIFLAAILAALPAVIRALRIDPVILLRSE